MGVGVDVDVDVGVDGGLFLSLNRLKIIWYIVWVYITLVRFKEPKSGTKYKKVSALKSEILIKYKRVNQMDPTRETLRLFASQGEKSNKLETMLVSYYYKTFYERPHQFRLKNPYSINVGKYMIGFWSIISN